MQYYYIMNYITDIYKHFFGFQKVVTIESIILHDGSKTKFVLDLVDWKQKQTLVIPKTMSKNVIIDFINFNITRNTELLAIGMRENMLKSIDVLNTNNFFDNTDRGHILFIFNGNNIVYDIVNENASEDNIAVILSR